MKRLQACVILAALYLCQSGHSESPSEIQVLHATYGTDSVQIDVTEKVQSLVKSGQTNVRIGNHLFGKDPVFGKTKTLSVTFSSNGAYYRAEMREGEQLSFLNAHQVHADPSLSALGGTLNAAATPQPPVSLGPRPPRLAPDGTYFLTGSTSVMKSGALIGLHAGTPVKFVRDNGNTIRVEWGGVELDVDKRIITNDLDIAEAAVERDLRTQGALANWMAEQQRVAQEEQRKQYETPAPKISKPKEVAETPPNSQKDDLIHQDLIGYLLKMDAQRRSGTNPLDRGAYNTPNREAQQILESFSPPPSNPLDRGAYNKTATFSPQKPTGSTGLQHQIEILDIKIKNAESMRHSTTNLTRQQIDAKVEALKAERDTLYRMDRIQREQRSGQ